MNLAKTNVLSVASIRVEVDLLIRVKLSSKDYIAAELHFDFDTPSDVSRIFNLSTEPKGGDLGHRLPQALSD